MARDPNSPLGAGQALDRIVELDAIFERRKKELVAKLSDEYTGRARRIRERVPEDQRPHLDRMIVAYAQSQQAAKILALLASMVKPANGEPAQEPEQAQEPGS